MQRNSSRLFWALRHSTFSNWIFQKKISSVRIMNVAVAFHQLWRCFRTMQAYCNPTYRDYHRLQTTQQQKDRERERGKKPRAEQRLTKIHDMIFTNDTTGLRELSDENGKTIQTSGVFRFKSQFRVCFHLSFRAYRKPQLAASIMDEQKI